MTLRVLLTAMLLSVLPAAALAGSGDDVIAAPVLRASVTVSDEVVRIGDLIDNAGTAAQIAVYRAPDLGMTGSLPTAQLLSVLRAHQVIGVDTRDLKQVSITRLARTLERKDIELQVARALEHRNGLGDAVNLSLSFDRDLEDVRLAASNSGAMQPTAVRYEPRNGRFDVTFQIANDDVSASTQLRFTGRAIETVEAAVLTRDIERNEVLRSSDVVVERRARAEVGNDATNRDRAIGMQSRRQIRAGQALRVVDLAKPDLVQRDQNVTLIFETAGIYLTIRGKALDGGAEGDVVNVLNLQSKRTISGVVIGRGQVSISIATPQLPVNSDATQTLGAAESTSAVSLAANNRSPVPSNPE
jgi:flagellar basal body P-ring formation protein FlgA